MPSKYSHGVYEGGCHTGRIVESLENMLNIYRQKCMDQSATIASLKDQIRVFSGNPVNKEPHHNVQGPPGIPAYVEDLVDEFDVLSRQNTMLEAELSRVKERLEVEEEWRAATLAWLESDARVQHIVSHCLGCKNTPKTRHAANDDATIHESYRSSLKYIAKKSKAFEKHMREKYSTIYCNNH